MNNSCGCCSGIDEQPAERIANRPGLPALAYRIGTHARFLATMQARLSSHELDVPTDELDEHGQPRTIRLRPLSGLTTRAADDPSLALLDAWGTVADVLTFYQERLANEGYLGTATERRSVLELARLVGYTLRPGVAGTVYLAFTLDRDYSITIPTGTRAQSVPGPGQLPQSFETADPLTARAAWNVLGPRQTRPQRLAPEQLASGRPLYLKGISTNLKPNDPLLLDPGQGQPTLYRVRSVQPDALADRTRVELQPWQLATTAELSAAAVRETIARFRDLERFGVQRGDTAVAVIEHLDALEARVAAGLSQEQLAETLNDDTLPGLRERLRLARDSHFTRLEPWLADLTAELSTTLERIAPPSASRAGFNGDDGSDDDGGGDEAGGLSSALLQALVEPLTRPASIQPANSLRLSRDPQTIFGARSDTATRMLAALRPGLADQLYTALRSAAGTPSSPARVYALRTRASVFGHNAPPRPITRDNGTVSGYQEWTLFNSIGVQREPFLLQIRPQQHGEGGFELDIALRLGDDEIRDNRTLSQDPEASFVIDFPAARERISVQVRLSSGDELEVNGLTLVLRFANRPLLIEIDVRSGRFTVQTTGSDPSRALFNLGNIRTSGISVAASAGAPIVIQGQISSSAGVPTERERVVSLDSSYPQIVPDSWVVLERPEAVTGVDALVVARAVRVAERSRADYGISGKGTSIELSRRWLNLDADSFAAIRGTSVLAQSELLELAEEPLDPLAEAVCGDYVELDGLYDGLEAGRWLIISGERSDVSAPEPSGSRNSSESGSQRVAGVPASELVMLASVEQVVDPSLPGETAHTRLFFASGLAYCYRRDTATIYGNVARATHGETRSEILGSGDGSKALQSFMLRQSPLTFVSAATPSGIASTLELRVNDVRWHETDSLATLGPTDHRYLTRTDDEQKTTVVFGNGTQGARLPSGVENVRAVYRTGIGKGGNVGAGQISLLVSRPLGLKEVINPLPATGGADRESRDQARENAPLAVTALDRLVSVQDYADFARTFAGIGKSSAQRLSDGRRQLIHVTIAGADDIPIAASSDLYRNLRQALHQFGDPFQPVQLAVRELLVLVLSAGVGLLPDYAWEFVEPNVRAALLDAFSFARRDLGQHALLSEVLSTIQHVPGVAYVDVDLFDAVGESTSAAELAALAETLSLRQRIVAGLARRDLAASTTAPPIRPAQIALFLAALPETILLRELP